MISIALLAAALAQPASPAPITATTTVYAEQVSVTPDGRRTVALVPPRWPKTGDAVVTVSTITNHSLQQTVSGAPAWVPLPPALRFVSAEGDAELSADGHVWGPLESLKVREGAGERAAHAGDIRFIRWTIDGLAPGARTERRFRALVR